MKRELCRLREGTEQEPAHDQPDPAALRQLIRPLDRFRHRVAVERDPDEEDRGEQREPAPYRHPQRHERRIPRVRALGMEADQEERENARRFPEQVEDEQVVREDRAQHRGHEKQDLGEEPRSARLRFLRHVRAGVDHDERADPGDEQREEQREPIQPQREIHPERRSPGHPFGDGEPGLDGRREADECGEETGRQEREKPARGPAFEKAGNRPGRAAPQERKRKQPGDHRCFTRCSHKSWTSRIRTVTRGRHTLGAMSPTTGPAGELGWDASAGQFYALLSPSGKLVPTLTQYGFAD